KLMRLIYIVSKKLISRSSVTMRRFLRCSFFFSSRRRHTRCLSDWSSDVCSSDLSRSTTKTLPYFGASQVSRPTPVLTSIAPGGKIGRASCRERVELGLVGVLIKKKNTSFRLTVMVVLRVQMVALMMHHVLVSLSL